MTGKGPRVRGFLAVLQHFKARINRERKLTGAVTVNRQDLHHTVHPSLASCVIQGMAVQFDQTGKVEYLENGVLVPPSQNKNVDEQNGPPQTTSKGNTQPKICPHLA